MKFAVTGGAGFIGSNIVCLLLERGDDVTVIDNLHAGRTNNIPHTDDHLRFCNIDIRDKDSMHSALDGIDGVFHQAALTNVQESFVKQQEYHDVNVDGTKTLFDLTSRMQIKTVYASSASIYGNATQIPIKETHARSPINPYGQTKLDCEILAERYCRSADAGIMGLRYFNVYGTGQTGSYAGVITRFMHSLGKSEPPTIFGNGSQIRDFVHVQDVARANLAAMDAKIKNGFYNIGTGIATSILQLANEMIRLTKPGLKPTFFKQPVEDIEKSLADITLARTRLGWVHRISLEEGLKGLLLHDNNGTA